MKKILRGGGVVVLSALVAYFLFSLYPGRRHAALDTVILPAESPVNHADRFAVVTEPYVALQDRPGTDGIVVSHARQNEVYEIVGTQFVSDEEKSTLWVRLANGWVEHSYVALYSSKARAKAASARLQ